MQEKIGQITLDYTYYPGRDLYTDGEVEQQLLEIAMTRSEEELNAEIAARKDWAVLYHMSDIRENIAAALPITKKDRVLEIGAGCGAVTGCLARMAAEVTCIDLSRRRSLINAHRHKDYENIRILVGNFQDIEQHMTEQYDCITLIGVFEYARGYIGTREPYGEFLRQIKRHLAPGGKIIMAIENRLGLKYWAGFREDHTGNFFEGPENYRKESYVRTFSRPELEKIFAAAGFTDPVFYYPYPDYKLPLLIHSDDCLPEPGALHGQMYHFDRDRMVLFDEKAVLDSLIESGQYPLFANSYLVILQDGANKKEPEEEHLIYTKFSVERDRRFAIRTDIVETPSGQRRVIKRAAAKEAEAHIGALAAGGRALCDLYEGTKLHVNRIEEFRTQEDGCSAAVLEYIACTKTLESLLRELTAAGENREAEDLVQELADLVCSRADQPFAVTEDFQALFGNEAGDALQGRTLQSAVVTDLDMVAENLLLRADGDWDLIDYEWSYTFPIPVDFVIYRIWHYFAARCMRVSSEELFLREKGFAPEDIRLFAQMEHSYQQHVRGQRATLDELHRQMAPQEVHVRSELMLREEPRAERFEGSVYYSGDGTFSEECRKGTRLDVDADGHFRAVIELDHIPAGSRLRWDPLERRMCRIAIEKTDCPEAVFVPMNGVRRENPDRTGCRDEFMTTDPAYRIENVPEGVTRICLKGSLEMIYMENRMQQFEQLRLERDAYKAELERLRAQFDALHLTKLYRAFKRLKGLIKD